MNVLFAANYPANEGYAWNTIEAVIRQVAEGLQAQGAGAHICYPSAVGIPPTPPGGTTVPVHSGDYPAARHSRKGLLRFVRLLRTLRIDTLYLTDQPTLDPNYAVLRAAGVRRILVHDRTSGERATSTPRHALKRVLHHIPLVSADRVIAVSDFVAARLRNVGGVPADRVTRVHNGIVLSRFDDLDTSRLRTIIAAPPSIPVAFFAARANLYKGFTVLVEAAARLQANGTDVAVVCCGDGPDLRAFREAARVHGLRYVFFLGKRADVPTLLAGADIAVVPSLWAEAFGLSVIEAMAAGVAIVGARIGGIPELIDDGRTGFLVPPGNPDALASALRTLILDTELRARVARAGQERAREYFGVERTVKELLQVFAALDAA